MPPGCITGKHHTLFARSLTHCSCSNVDRIFAIWQDLYPNKYVQTFSTGRGVTKPNDPLAPFHTDTKSTPWNATLCRYTKDCGYAYPELQKWLDIYKTAGKFDNVKYQKAIRTSIELKYSTTGKSTLQLRENAALADAHLASLPAMNLAVENFPPVLVKKALALKSEEAHAQLPIQATATTVTAAAVPVQASAVKPAPIMESHVAAAGFLTLSSSPAAAQHPIVAPAPSPVAKEKWNENDYIVNVLFDRYVLPFRTPPPNFGCLKADGNPASHLTATPTASVSSWATCRRIRPSSSQTHPPKSGSSTTSLLQPSTAALPPLAAPTVSASKRSTSSRPAKSSSPITSSSTSPRARSCAA